MPFKTQRYQRKPIYVDGIEVTEDNMAELANWCKGKIRKTRGGTRYIFVDVLNPKEPKQSKAFAGDMLLKSPTGFKVYTQRGFAKAFDAAPEE